MAPIEPHWGINEVTRTGHHRLLLIHRFRFGLFATDDKLSCFVDERVTIDRQNLVG